MNTKKLVLKLLVAGAVLAATGRLVSKTVSAEPIPGDVSFDDVDAFVQRQMDQLNIPGAALALVKGDKIVHVRGFGRARPGGETPTPQTPFFVGSLTKSFTALAVMQLAQAGKVALDAPVQRYLPWFRVADSQASAEITVRHLLNQTSGLSTASGRIPLEDFDDSPGAAERQARALSTLRLSHPVGSAFEYSNSNYNLLGLIVEAASGESYADYGQKHIFTPLEMSHTFTSQATARQNGLAVGHQYWFANPIAAPDVPVPLGLLSSGQLISCSEDMAHYLIALANGGRYGSVQILSPEGIDELHRGVAEDVEMGISMGKYGMGWFVSEIGQTQTAWHTGIVPNFFSYMALLPEQKTGVVLLLNAYGYLMTPPLSEFGTGVATLLAGDQPAPIQFGFMPWVQRGLLLIPFLQIIAVASTLWRLRRWRRHPMSRPSGRGMWRRNLLLPLIPNLLVTLTLIPLVGATRGFWMYYMPDYTWIAILCSGFAGIWSLLRTGLVLSALRQPAENRPNA